MAFGKNKNVIVVPTFTITLDKSDSSYTGYDLVNDRNKCISGLETANNWGIASVELENEPAKNSVSMDERKPLKVKRVSLLNHPNSTKGHQDSGVYKYYVDSPTRGGGTKDRLWLENCTSTITGQTYGGCNTTTKIHTLNVHVTVKAKVKITAGH